MHKFKSFAFFLVLIGGVLGVSEHLYAATSTSPVQVELLATEVGMSEKNKNIPYITMVVSITPQNEDLYYDWSAISNMGDNFISLFDMNGKKIETKVQSLGNNSLTLSDESNGKIPKKKTTIEEFIVEFSPSKSGFYYAQMSKFPLRLKNGELLMYELPSKFTISKFKVTCINEYSCTVKPIRKSKLKLPSITLKTSPKPLQLGDSGIISWNVKSANYCRGGDDLKTKGKFMITPDHYLYESGYFDLTCYGNGGKATKVIKLFDDSFYPENIKLSRIAPNVNYMDCGRDSEIKFKTGYLACYGLWDFGNAFGGDQNMCPEGTTSGGGCTVRASMCSSGIASASRVIDVFEPWHSFGELPTEGDLNSISINLRTALDVIQKELIQVWEYKCT